MRLAIRPRAWRDPVEAFGPFAHEPFALLLLSDGAGAGRWSYICRSPDAVEAVGPNDPGEPGFARVRALLGPRRPNTASGPPFQGGVVGLIAYEFANRIERLDLPRDADWPDLFLARYGAVISFDHASRAVLAIGRGRTQAAAEDRADEAASWLTAPAAGGDPAVSARFDPPPPGADYEAAVAEVIGRILGGEIFQANIARAWTGRLVPPSSPFDVMRRLSADSPAPYGAYWRLPGRALVSHSPEQFLAVGADGRSVCSRPIKGTRPRGADPAADAALRAALIASDKDRAENLMIVDLVRNDLARVCEPGSVRADRLFAVESYRAVHHLVSTVTGRLAAGRDAADLLVAAFPPGSITGAPKIQAMTVIARHERPRGPWCGSLFWAGFDGALDSSVLIRTAAFVEDAEGWRFRACAGAGIVADSNPVEERLETEAKFSGMARALGRAV